MPKRKRGESEAAAATTAAAAAAAAAAGNESGEDQGKSIRQRRVEQKLDHGRKLLSRAFKVAKGFERQKLSRRRKTAAEKSDAKEVVRIDAEAEATKTLDLSSAARNYLHKSLLKFKAVAESPDLPQAVTTPAPPMPNPATANVIARLCNSNPVKEALPSVLRDIQQALGLKVSEDALKGKKRLRAKDFDKSDKLAGVKNGNAAVDLVDDSMDDDDDDDSVSAADKDAAVVQRRMQRRPHSDNEDDFSDDLDGPEPGDDYDSDDFAQFDDRIAGSSDDEEDDAEKDGPVKGKTSSAKALRAAVMDISPSPSPSPSPGPESRRKSGAKMAKPTTSAFVPSLSLGGYWSGSESEPEDDIDVAPARKNRRGQRARQAIAEKKYGQKAKHLQRQSNNDRNKGWDPKRGATDRTGPRDRGAPRDFGRAAPRTREGRHAEKAAPPPKKHRDDQGPLHPSWEAAKKAKEAKAIPAFQGKKISFD